MKTKSALSYYGSDAGVAKEIARPPSLDIHVGDCLESLRAIPDESVNCIVTSPPFWGLRDYGWDGQIGLEQTPGEYVQKLVAVFREARRVLRADGTCWIEIGDTYAGSWGAQSKNNTDAKRSLGSVAALPSRPVAGSRSNTGLKPKDLCSIPWRVALALQADGWYLRQDIIWNRPNPMPSSVQDRCTTSHSYVFLLTKSKSYFYDAEAIKEPAVTGDRGSSFTSGKSVHQKNNVGCGERANDLFRNKRSVWTIPTSGYAGAHFAVFPPKLIEPMILAGSPEKVCSACGSPEIRQVEKVRVPTRPGHNSKLQKVPGGWDVTEGRTVGNRDLYRHVTTTKTTGFKLPCDCNAGASRRGVVLDLFAGSGTTGQVAMGLGRDAIMLEGNPDYTELIRKRCQQNVLLSEPEGD